MPQRVVAEYCRRDTPFPLLATLLARQLEAQKLDPLALKAIGSVTFQKKEPAIQLASCCRVPFKTFTAEALREFLEHHFPGSGFAVRKTVGVGKAYPPGSVVIAATKVRARPCENRASLLL